MGLILDLAVVAVAMVVIASLALLAWTLGVSGARAVADERERVAAMRRSVAELKGRLRSLARSAGEQPDA